jgi:hypothetical protein
MKTLITFFLALSLVLSLSFSQQKVILPASTVVAVKTLNRIASDNIKAGQEIVLTIAADVTVKGVKVIKAGTAAVGMVESAESAGMVGTAGKLTISIQSTTAVDGTNITLSGNLYSKGDSKTGESVAAGVILCPLALLCKGEEGDLPAGFQTRALTIGEYEIIITE